MGGRRMLLLLLFLTLLGIPASVLSLACAGRSCVEGDDAASPVPFCQLPAGLRDKLANGYQEGRSPDVLGVGDSTPIFTYANGTRTPWPAIAAIDHEHVPVVFSGAGVAGRASLPDHVALDAIAPTVSEIIELERPFPEVRSGKALRGVADGQRPRLVLMVAWKGVGSAELEARQSDWPFLSSLLRDGAGTLRADAGSMPLDPAATLTTIGTGGLPTQHGITGSFIRNDEGRVVQAFGADAPVTVIATLADDLDHAEPSSLVGLVATDDLDRGIVGGGWYPDEDTVDVVTSDGAAAPLAVAERLSTGYGADDVPDVLGVVLEGSVRSMDRWTRRIVADAERSTGASTLVVVAGTGSQEAPPLALPEDGLVEAVEEAVPGEAHAVMAAVPGGLFLDQDLLRREQVTGLVAVEAMLSANAPSGEPLLTDAFQGFAVSLSRYC